MDAIKRMMEKRWMKERKKERKTNPQQQQQQHHQTVIATATENKRGVCTEMKTVWLCAEAHHGKRKRPFFLLLLLYVTIQSKAKQVLCIIRSYSGLSAGVCVCGVCLCICVFQSETQSRSFIICFQLRFDSLHEQAIYVHDDDSAKLHHLFIILYTYNTVWFFLHILSRYYPFHCFKNV